MCAVSTNNLRTEKEKSVKNAKWFRGVGGSNLVSQFTEIEVSGDKFYSKHISKDYLKM